MTLSSCVLFMRARRRHSSQAHVPHLLQQWPVDGHRCVGLYLACRRHGLVRRSRVCAAPLLSCARRSDTEKFVIVSDDYNVRTFNLQGASVFGFLGARLLSFSRAGEASGMFALTAEVKDQGILDAQVWGSGLVVLTKRFQFCLVSNIEDPRPIMMANSGQGELSVCGGGRWAVSDSARAGLPSAPTSWTVIEPQFTAHGTAEVLAAHPNGSSGVRARGSLCFVPHTPRTRRHDSDHRHGACYGHAHH